MSSNHPPTPSETKLSKTKADIGLFEFVTLMALMTSLVALSIDAVLPALTQIGTDLGITDPRQNHLIV
jgi:DHA1 family bicyclomycin/chloramphenicol resistance-like MFS transporter